MIFNQPDRGYGFQPVGYTNKGDIFTINRSFYGRKEKNMSTGFNWFKSYKITIHKGNHMFDYDETKLEYIGGDDTSILVLVLEKFKT